MKLGSRFPFPGLPSGWYVVAVSDEVKRGQIVSRHYFNTDIVIYRMQDGVVRIADPFCPHMGAHLGRMGTIDGNTLRCGFHGFQYDGEGRCVATSYEGPPPARAKLRFWEAREQNGLILTWYGAAGESYDWEVPVLDDTGWNKIRWHRFDIPTHPQETTENSVDFGHFTQVHGFVEGSITRAIEIDGPLLTTAYRAHRPLPMPAIPLWKLPVDYAVTVWGLGYSQVDVRIDPLWFDIRVWVLPTPRDDEHIDLIIGASTKKGLGPISAYARRIAHKIVCKEVGEDLDIWTYKKYIEQPPLAKGDGPIAVYRRYVKQFYAPIAGANDERAVNEAVAQVAAHTAREPSSQSSQSGPSKPRPAAPSSGGA
jgi:nitrite reductase/ring-hydroxylating ferredoxin subunit